MPDFALDLGGRIVTIVTEDAQFADDLTTSLAAWRARARWITLSEEVLRDRPSWGAGKEPPVVIVDGRIELLTALTFAQRVCHDPMTRPYLLFVGDVARIHGLTDDAAGEMAALLPAPLDDRTLEDALRALPAAPAGGVIADQVEPSPFVDAIPSRPSADDRSVVVPIAARASTGDDGMETLDRTTIAALQSLGGADLLRELVEAFRIDSHRLMQDIGRASSVADSRALHAAAQALENCAAGVGGSRLRAALGMLRGSDGADLFRRADTRLRRVEFEVDALQAALAGASADMAVDVAPMPSN